MASESKSAGPRGGVKGGVQAQIERGDALAAQRKPAAALKAYRAALDADPRSALACRRIVQVCSEARLPEQGLEAARRLLELEPQSVFAAAAEGDLLEGLGRLEEAYARLAPRVRAGERDPYLVSVYGRVCERIEPTRDEAVPLLRALAADAAVPPRRRVRALWTLVHTLDALGRYDEAFAHAQELKALEAREGIGRPPSNRARIDAAITPYTPQRLARLPRARHGSELPLFVVGMLRSGTTLVEQILAAHPEVHGAGELSHISSIALRDLPAAQPYPACLDALTQERVDALARAHLATLAGAAPGARRVVDKMPTNFEHLGLIELLFPQARVIHCVREPLDTCLSLYFLPDCSHTETLAAVGESYSRYRRIMAHWRSRLALRMLTVRYEELVAEPERKVRELLEFCGLPWHDACLEFHRSGRHPRNFSYHQVRKPLYTRSVGRHRHYARHLAPLQAALAAPPRRKSAPLAEADAAITRGEHARGAELARAALAAGAPAALAHFSLARAHSGLGREDLAEAAYRTAIAADPTLPQAHNNLGNLLIGLARYDEAIVCLRRALELKPDYSLAYFNLGNALKRAGRAGEAIGPYRRALELKPDYPHALNNLGNAFYEEGRTDEAEPVLRRALALDPRYAEAHNNLAGVVWELGRLDEAIASYRQAAAIAPQLAEARYGLGLALLTRGEYPEGWQQCEARWHCAEFPGRKRWMGETGAWHGERFDGRTLLVYFEQGMGDSINLVRYIPLVAERGARVVLEVQRPLLRLFAPFTRWAQVIAAGEPRPAFDLHCALQSLPLIFGTTLQTIPGTAPYLRAEPGLAAKWRARLDPGPGLKVGLVWAGNPRQKSEPRRRVGLKACLPLLDVPGVRWYSLQVGEQAPDVLQAPAGAIADLSGELTDFAETAAAVANLDLVITTDTAVAHLAGALGAPAWVMLHSMPDWRWCAEGATWYPSLRLFRQTRRADWSTVIEPLKAALAALAARRGLEPHQPELVQPRDRA